MVILASTRICKDQKTGEIRDCLDQRWMDLVVRMSGTIIPVPNNPAMTDSILNRACPEGIILTGGGDLGALDPDMLIRDEVEKVLINYAIARPIPVLGVCRGAQFLASFFGAKLHSLNGHVATHHHIRVGQGERSVNSFHNFGISDLPNSLTGLATHVKDRSIEAFKHTRLPILGILWHPEREQPFKEVDMAMFRALFYDHAICI